MFEGKLGRWYAGQVGLFGCASEEDVPSIGQRIPEAWSDREVLVLQMRWGCFPESTQERTDGTTIVYGFLFGKCFVGRTRIRIRVEDSPAGFDFWLIEYER